MIESNPMCPPGDAPDGRDTETGRTEQDRRAIRELLLQAFAALPDASREAVLVDDGDEDAPEGADQ